MKKVILFWSGGKDSALALWHLKKDPDVEVIALLTTLSEKTNSNEIHGLPETLYTEQAKLLGLPLIRVYLKENPTNEEYESAIYEKIKILKKTGVNALAFGDIHQQEIRSYREKIAQNFELQAIFPLWNKNHQDLLATFFEMGFKAIVTAIHRDKLDNTFLNKEFNRQWLSELPNNIDPMGENGEYHTIITFMPGFKIRLNYSKSMAVNVGPYLVTQTREA